MIFMLAGTSDARDLALALQRAGYAVTATVVTESAASSLADVGLPHLIGRLTAEEMATIMTEQGYRLVVDASHPFAEEASKNAMAAAEQAKIPYIRYERAHEHYAHPLITVVKDYEEAAQLAAEKRGVIMLNTSSNVEYCWPYCIFGRAIRIVSIWHARAASSFSSTEPTLPLSLVIINVTPY